MEFLIWVISDELQLRFIFADFLVFWLEVLVVIWVIQWVQNDATTEEIGDKLQLRIVLNSLF